MGLTKSSRGGFVTILNIKGPGLDQDMWLNSSISNRKSILSSVGGIRLIELSDLKLAEQIISTTNIESKAIGMIKVWYPDPNKPLEFLIEPGQSVVLGDSKHELKIIKYVPHYTINTLTKEVTSKSDKAINPAIKVGFYDGSKNHEQWLWSRKPLPGHKMEKLPFRIEFTDFDVLGTKGQYIVVGVEGGQRWIIFEKDEKKYAEKLELNRPYLFANKEYSFTITEVADKSIVKSEWHNESEELINPAIVAVIEENGNETQLLLEYNKANHFGSESGTIILHYHQQGSSHGMNN